MKTLLLTLEYLPFYGGIAHYYGHLIKYYPASIEVLDNNKDQLINNALPIKWLPAVIKLWQAVRAEKINHVLVGQLLPLGTVAWLLAPWLKFKYTIFLHGYDLSLAMSQPKKVKLVKKILNKAHKIICANSYTAEQVKTIIDQKQLGKVRVVNPGVEKRPVYNKVAVEKLRANYDLGNKVVLFSLGRLVERKGFDQVIASLPLVIKKVPNLVYYIAGTGPDQEYLKNRVKELPTDIQLKVKFIGSLNEADKWHWLDVCDIFIMPARKIGNDVEGFGIVYLEAGLAGKPVIAGKSGGVADAVVDNLTGLMVNPVDNNQIAQAIIKLSKYEGLRQRLGDHGRERALKQFNWQQLAQRAYNIISK